jgi:hypothetical protein
MLAIRLLTPQENTDKCAPRRDTNERKMRQQIHDVFDPRGKPGFDAHTGADSESGYVE